MWFRNLRIYRFAQSFDFSAETLEQALTPNAFRPCGPLEPVSLGWTAPLEQGELLVHAANACLLICIRREERVLPAAVVREAVAERVAALEAEREQPLRRREKLELRDQVTAQLLPQAFTRSSRLYAYIDPRKGLLVVDTASATRAEELLSLLRQSLGSLAVRPLEVERAPPVVMTRWLAGDLPKGLVLGDECELRELSEEGALVRARGVELDGDEVQVHLDAGKQPTQVAVQFEERLGCVVGADLVLRKLRFLEFVEQEAATVSAEDAAARFDADFALMSAELGDFLPRLVQAFGGYAAAQ